MQASKFILTQAHTDTTKKPSRLPRFQRVSNPPRMVLMERDVQILHQVHQCRLMTRAQIERLLFPPDHGQDHPTKTSRVRRRLKLLYQNGYLERIAAPVDPRMWALRPVYRLSAAGARLVADELKVSPAEIEYWG